jgi:hypothetical protein
MDFERRDSGVTVRRKKFTLGLDSTVNLGFWFRRGPQLLRGLKWGVLFDETMSLTATGHSAPTGGGGGLESVLTD